MSVYLWPAVVKNGAKQKWSVLLWKYENIALWWGQSCRCISIPYTELMLWESIFDALCRLYNVGYNKTWICIVKSAKRNLPIFYSALMAEINSYFSVFIVLRIYNYGTGGLMFLWLIKDHNLKISCWYKTFFCWSKCLNAY